MFYISKFGGLVSSLARKASAAVKELEPSDQMELLRIKSTKQEVILKKYSEHCDIDVADFGDGGGFLSHDCD